MFQYMLLLRGATNGISIFGMSPSFQYMLLLRGATHAPQFATADSDVSIHAPLARSNRTGRSPVRRSACFNTCSSCEEQLEVLFCVPSLPWFQYMLLLRGATRKRKRFRVLKRFQYMLLLRGATQTHGGDDDAECFNTCSSCEEQL